MDDFSGRSSLVYSEILGKNVKSDMDSIMNGPLDPNVRVHKDPNVEATKYIFKNEVIDLFKVQLN